MKTHLGTVLCRVLGVFACDGQHEVLHFIEALDPDYDMRRPVGMAVMFGRGDVFLVMVFVVMSLIRITGGVVMLILAHMTVVMTASVVGSVEGLTPMKVLVPAVVLIVMPVDSEVDYLTDVMDTVRDKQMLDLAATRNLICTDV